MSISPLPSRPQDYHFGTAASDQSAKNDFNALTTDLKMNDIAGAQKDFAAMLSDASQLKSELQQGDASVSPQSSALSSLSTALQAGDVAGAQTALGSLGRSLNGSSHHHHHHHHHGSSNSSGSDATDPGTSAGAQALTEDIHNLDTALKSGDMTAAQAAFAQFRQDFPSCSGKPSASGAPSSAVAS